MSEDQLTDAYRHPSRRSTLQTLGTLLAAGGVSGAVAAQQDDGTYQIHQAGETLSVEPISGDVPVEERYSYRLPDQYAGVGVHDVDGGPYYESAGTQDLQRESTTITFLYDGPNGLSLVTVHDMATPDGDGGSVSWDVVVEADDAEWLVRDDLYWDRETGERPPSNVDNWDVEGDEHRIDWTWSGQATDGGVLGYLDDDSALLIDPAYNEAAALYGDQYEGEVTDWQFLSGDDEDPDRYALALDEPLAVVGPDGDAASVEGRLSDDTTETETESTETETEATEDDETETGTEDDETEIEDDETETEETETDDDDDETEFEDDREDIEEHREAVEDEWEDLEEKRAELEEEHDGDEEDLREVIDEKREEIEEKRAEIAEKKAEKREKIAEKRTEIEDEHEDREDDDEPGLGLGRGNGNGPKKDKGNRGNKRGKGKGKGNGRGRGK